MQSPMARVLYRQLFMWVLHFGCSLQACVHPPHTTHTHTHLTHTSHTHTLSLLSHTKQLNHHCEDEILGRCCSGNLRSSPITSTQIRLQQLWPVSSCRPCPQSLRRRTSRLLLLWPYPVLTNHLNPIRVQQFWPASRCSP